MVVWPGFPVLLADLVRTVTRMAGDGFKHDEIGARLRAFFAADAHGAVAVYLFGSVSRGDAGPDSDVDVAVLSRTTPPARFEALPLRLEEDLERLLGRCVEVVVLNRAAPDLIHRVFRDGKLVLDLDPSFRIGFEVRARNEYFDLQPVLRRYRKLDRESGKELR